MYESFLLLKTLLKKFISIGKNLLKIRCFKSAKVVIIFDLQKMARRNIAFFLKN